MSCADSIKKLLVDVHFTSCFTKVCPSALDCAEPIVVAEDAFSRESRMAEEERGTVAVTVMVVREAAADAEDVATAAELTVRRADWEAICGRWLLSDRGHRHFGSCVQGAGF